MVEAVEKPITLTQAKAYYLRYYGLNVARATLKRWAKKGVRGVRLQHEIHGDWYYTKESWIRDFQRRRQAPQAEPESGGQGLTPSDLRRSEAARQELIRRGLIRERKTAVPCVRPSDGLSRAVLG
jgi:hypothetical protein